MAQRRVFGPHRLLDFDAVQFPRCRIIQVFRKAVRGIPPFAARRLLLQLPDLAPQFQQLGKILPGLQPGVFLRQRRQRGLLFRAFLFPLFCVVRPLLFQLLDLFLRHRSPVRSVDSGSQRRCNDGKDRVICCAVVMAIILVAVAVVTVVSVAAVETLAANPAGAACTAFAESTTTSPPIPMATPRLANVSRNRSTARLTRFCAASELMPSADAISCG